MNTGLSDDIRKAFDHAILDYFKGDKALYNEYADDIRNYTLRMFNQEYPVIGFSFLLCNPILLETWIKTACGELMEYKMGL